MDDKVIKSFTVHTLVANAFLAKEDKRLHINHIDGDKTNNNLNNLEWCTPTENIRHAFKNGMVGLAKKPVIRSDGKVFESASDAQRSTGVSQSNICQCCLGRKEDAGGFNWEYKKHD